MSEQLKPCPFCGNGSVIRPEDEERYGFFVTCLVLDPDAICYCALGENYDASAMPDHMFPTREAAAAAWNARVDSRSDLARKVLSLVSGFSREIRKKDLEALLNDLFTREQIDLGETT